MHKIAEWPQIDFDTFHSEIVPANKPALIRSLVGDWPAVVTSRGSSAATCEYLQRLDIGTPVYTIAAAPTAGGRFFYSDDLTGVNFKRGQIALAQVLAQLLAQDSETEVHTIAVQALPVREALPEFERENVMAFVDASVPPTMWIGNRGRVAPHYDVHKNLACVVAGRRKFTLFPPDQIANLYPGPILGAPGGVPISMVDIWNPDLDVFPRYAEAADAAQEAILEPGDALYIPSLWWHAVAALESINVLVNYWWGGIGASGISPNDTLLHGMLAIAGLDDSQRQAWHDFFEYYVFGTGECPNAHLPSGINDIVTSLSAEQDTAVREFLSAHLKKSE